MSSLLTSEERRWLKRKQRRTEFHKVVGFLTLIALTLGAVFLVWDFLRSPEAEAAQHVDDSVLCADPLTSPSEINEYCVDLMKRGL